MVVKSPQTFDLDTELSGSVKVVALIPWASHEPTSDIKAIARVKGDDTKTIVQCNRPHGLKPGDWIYVTGIGFQVDGKHEVIMHKVPSPTINFCIDTPKGLPEGRTEETGYIRPERKYEVILPEHLPVDETLRLSKLNYATQANYQAKSKYQGVAEKGLLLEMAVGDAADRFYIGVPSAKRKKKAKPLTDKEREYREEAVNNFQAAILAIAELTEEELIDKAIKALAENHKVSAESFALDIKEIAAAHRRVAEGVEIEPTEFNNAFDREALRLKKEEIEILCLMPPGAMDALDMMKNAKGAIEKMYIFVKQAVVEARKDSTPLGSEGKEQAERAEKT